MEKNDILDKLALGLLAVGILMFVILGVILFQNHFTNENYTKVSWFYPICASILIGCYVVYRKKTKK